MAQAPFSASLLSHPIFATDPAQTLPFPRLAPNKLCRRGNEIFVGEANILKVSESDESTYKVVNVPIDFVIESLCINPSGTYLAVLGSNDILIVTLPPVGFYFKDIHASQSFCKRLELPVDTTDKDKDEDEDDLNRIVKCLWHPLSRNDCTLVVLLSSNRLCSFEVNQNYCFPHDIIDLSVPPQGPVASNSFGLLSEEDDDSAFVSMVFGKEGDGTTLGLFTLYLLSEEGDIYGLCPYIPPHCAINSAYMQTLFDSVILDERESRSEGPIPPQLRHQKINQVQYLTDIWRQVFSNKNHPSGNQDISIDSIPARASNLITGSLPFERPASAPTLPALQGPFCLKPYPTAMYQDFQATDIATLEDPETDLRAIVISFVNGCIDIFLDETGLSCLWSSSQGAEKNYTFSNHDAITLGKEHCLSFLERIHLQMPTDQIDTGLRLFSDPESSPFVTFAIHNFGIHSIDVRPWYDLLSNLIDTISYYEESPARPMRKRQSTQTRETFERVDSSKDQELSKEVNDILQTHRSAVNTMIDSQTLHGGVEGYAILKDPRTAIYVFIVMSREKFASFPLTNVSDVQISKPLSVARSPQVPRTSGERFGVLNKPISTAKQSAVDSPIKSLLESTRRSTKSSPLSTSPDKNSQVQDDAGMTTKSDKKEYQSLLKGGPLVLNRGMSVAEMKMQINQIVKDKDTKIDVGAPITMVDEQILRYLSKLVDFLCERAEEVEQQGLKIHGSLESQRAELKRQLTKLAECYDLKRDKDDEDKWILVDRTRINDDSIDSFKERAEAVLSRQKKLEDRVEEMTDKLVKSMPQPLSRAEKEWIASLDRIRMKVNQRNTGLRDRSHSVIDQAKGLVAKLELSAASSSSEPKISKPSRPSLVGMDEFQILALQKLLNRESQIIEQTRKSLSRLMVTTKEDTIKT